jgi:hypothetical protein
VNNQNIILTMLVVTALSQGFDTPNLLLSSDGQKVELRDRLGTLWSAKKEQALELESAMDRTL